MKCAKCGYPLPEDSRFCQYCGARIEAGAESEDLFPASPELPAEEELVGAERARAAVSSIFACLGMWGCLCWPSSAPRWWG